MRIESSKFGPHLVRAFLAVFLLLVIIEIRSDDSTSAPGRLIFQSQILLTHLFLTINCVFGFSQVIIEERESGTLDLLKLAGINRLSIVLGKGLPRFLESLLLISVQFPFTLLTITMGGVGWNQVLAAYVYLLAYLVLVAGLGLFFSARCQKSQTAVVMTAIATFLYLLPYIFSVLGGWAFLVVQLSGLNLQSRTMAALQPGFNDSPWCAAVLIAVSVGCLLLITSSLILHRDTSRTAVDQLVPAAMRRPHKNRRAWKQAFRWLGYTLHSGGARRIVLRSGSHFALLAWMMVAQGRLTHGFAWAALLGCLVSLLDASWSASRLFSDEIGNQTWSVLVQTPNDFWRIITEKTLGWLIGMLPAIVLPYLFITLAIFTTEHIQGVGEHAEIIIGSLLSGLAVVTYLHLVVLLSLDWFWKAIPAALTATCVLAFVYVLMLVPWNSTESVRCIMFVVTGMFLVAFCVAFQFLIYTRLEKLSGGRSA